MIALKDISAIIWRRNYKQKLYDDNIGIIPFLKLNNTMKEARSVRFSTWSTSEKLVVKNGKWYYLAIGFTCTGFNDDYDVRYKCILDWARPL